MWDRIERWRERRRDKVLQGSEWEKEREREEGIHRQRSRVGDIIWQNCDEESIVNSHCCLFGGHMTTGYERMCQWSVVDKEPSLLAELEFDVRSRLPTEGAGPLIVVFIHGGLPVVVAVNVTTSEVDPRLSGGGWHSFVKILDQVDK